MRDVLELAGILLVVLGEDRLVLREGLAARRALVVVELHQHHRSAFAGHHHRHALLRGEERLELLLRGRRQPARRRSSRLAGRGSFGGRLGGEPADGHHRQDDESDGGSGSGRGTQRRGQVAGEPGGQGAHGSPRGRGGRDEQSDHGHVGGHTQQADVLQHDQRGVAQVEDDTEADDRGEEDIAWRAGAERWIGRGHAEQQQDAGEEQRPEQRHRDPGHRPVRAGVGAGAAQARVDVAEAGVGRIGEHLVVHPGRGPGGGQADGCGQRHPAEVDDGRGGRVRSRRRCGHRSNCSRCGRLWQPAGAWPETTKGAARRPRPCLDLLSRLAAYWRAVPPPPGTIWARVGGAAALAKKMVPTVFDAKLRLPEVPKFTGVGRHVVAGHARLVVAVGPLRAAVGRQGHREAALQRRVRPRQVGRQEAHRAARAGGAESHQRRRVRAAGAGRRVGLLGAVDRTGRADGRRLVAGHTGAEQAGDRDRRDDADDGHHDQQFDQGEALGVTNAHRCLCSVRSVRR